mmetsp:Transcript_26922/g.55685  ORF Transcript_26922/g.55685 Transcript_26922/m.55685 type:complete len:1325 (+) Transcript_26922:67-4041(+)
MAVALFDSKTSSKQDKLAKEERAKREGWGGSSANSRDMAKGMSADQIEKFKNSKVMQQTELVDQKLKEMMDHRMKQLQLSDPEWLPQDTDFTAPKSFKYDKMINYYGILGLPDHCAKSDIKAGYKRLSLVYHPDKCAGMEDSEKEKYGAIFIQLKNAYATLLDNPTRRQYDQERFREMIMCEMMGSKMKIRDQFWGYEMAEQKAQEKMEKTQGPGQTVDIPLVVRLEKFVYGGTESQKRMCWKSVKGEMTEREKVFRVDIPPGSEEPFVKNFHQKGSEYKDRMPDSLKFQITSHPHDHVTRVGKDLHLKKKVNLGADIQNLPYMQVEAASISGKHALVWGRNPFFKGPPSGKKEIQFEVMGEGAAAGGALCFSAVQGSELPPDKVPFLEKVQVWEVVGGGDKGGILVREGKETNSEKCDSRLDTGAMIRTLELDGDRLHYEKLPGAGGPERGWIATKLGPKDLVTPASDQFWRVTKPDGCGVRKKEDPASLAGKDLLPTGTYVKQKELKGDELFFNIWRGAPKDPKEGWVSVLGVLEQGAGKKVEKKTKGPDVKGIVNEVMKQRVLATHEGDLTSKVILSPWAEPINLFTQPPCSLTYYSNATQATQVEKGQVKPRLVFGLVISCKAAAEEEAHPYWEHLKNNIAPVVQASCFRLMRAMRGILPRPIADTPAEVPGTSTDPATLAVPWKALGDRSTRKRDFWVAAEMYTRGLDEIGDFSANVEKASEFLLLRASALKEVGFYDGVLADATTVTELVPTQALAWSLVGQAHKDYLKIYGREDAEERTTQCVAAFTKAVELGSIGDMEVLKQMASNAAKGGSREASAEENARGNALMKEGKFAEAVAAFTLAMAKLPTAFTPPKEGELDEAALKSQLCCNRSAAFSRLPNWHAAIADARAALGFDKNNNKARIRLGTALLGSGDVESAYPEFAYAVQIDEGSFPAREGMNSCLIEMVSHTSNLCRMRKARWHMDAHRPGGSRIFGVSDIHFDQKVNEDWCFAIDGSKFQDDILIIAGDMADTLFHIQRGLATLRPKFRRVFYLPGCHEFWITPPEQGTYIDSIAKLNDILKVCDSLGIDTEPAPICEGVFVVPLYSWYNASFDESDPFADADVDQNPMAKWPMDRNEQAWRYLLKMNEAALREKYYGTVVTFTHCHPRRELPYWSHVYHQSKFVGCVELEPQIKEVNSKVNLYGRSHRRYAKTFDGVFYVSMPLGNWDERMEEVPPLMMVYDGKAPCAKEWTVDNHAVAKPTIDILFENQYKEKMLQPGEAEKEKKALEAAASKSTANPFASGNSGNPFSGKAKSAGNPFMAAMKAKAAPKPKAAP